MGDSLPQYVRECGCCQGQGKYKQTYTSGCGGGYFRSMGRCDHCDGGGFLYKCNSKPVPVSVLEQIKQAGE